MPCRHQDHKTCFQSGYVSPVSIEVKTLHHVASSNVIVTPAQVRTEHTAWQRATRYPAGPVRNRPFSMYRTGGTPFSSPVSSIEASNISRSLEATASTGAPDSFSLYGTPKPPPTLTNANPVLVASMTLRHTPATRSRVISYFTENVICVAPRTPTPIILQSPASTDIVSAQYATAPSVTQLPACNTHAPMSQKKYCIERFMLQISNHHMDPKSPSTCGMCPLERFNNNVRRHSKF